jgi:hypothetical protein
MRPACYSWVGNPNGKRVLNLKDKLDNIESCLHPGKCAAPSDADEFQNIVKRRVFD